MELYLYFDAGCATATAYLFNRKNVMIFDRLVLPENEYFSPSENIPTKEGFISIDMLRSRCLKYSSAGFRLETIDFKHYSKHPFQPLRNRILYDNIGRHENAYSFDGKKVFTVNWCNGNVLIDLVQQTVVEKKLDNFDKVYMTDNLLITSDKFRKRLSFYELTGLNKLRVFSAQQTIDFQNFTLKDALSPHYLDEAYHELSPPILIVPKGKVVHNFRDYFHIFDPYNKEQKGLILVRYRDAMISYHCQNFPLIPPSSLFVFNVSYRPLSIQVPFIKEIKPYHVTLSLNPAYQLCPRLYLRKILNVYRLIVSLCRKQRYYDRDVCDRIFRLCYPIFSYSDMLLFRRYIDREITLKQLFPRH